MWSRNELPPCAISISPQLQQALNGRAIDDEPRRSKPRPSGPGQESAFNQTQNLKLLAQLGAVALRDRVRGPFIQVDIPQRAIVEGDRRNAAESVIRTVSIQEQGEESLPLRIVAGALKRPVHPDEEALDSAGKAIVMPNGDVAQQRRVGIAFDSGD